MSDQELTIKISAKNLTADEFAKARKEITGLNEATDKSKEASAKASKEWGSFKETLRTFGQVGAIVAGAIGGIAAGIIELGKRGSEINDIRENFNTLNRTIGLDGTQSIKTLQDATDGMISKFDLMKITNQALSQGLKVSDADLRTMGEGARVLSERVGGKAVEAYQAMTEAMATGQTRRLKEIGLNIDETTTLKTLAVQRNVDLSMLSEREQKAAKQNAMMTELNRILKESGRSTMDFGDTLEQAGTKFKDWLDDLASAVADSKTFGIALTSVTNIINTVFGGKNSQESIKRIVDLLERGTITTIEWGRTAVTAGYYVMKVFYSLQVVFDAVASGVARIGQYFFKLIEGLSVVASYVPIVGREFGANAQQAKELATWLGGAADGFENAGGAALQSMDAMNDTNSVFNSLDRTLSRVTLQMAEARRTTDEHTESLKENTKASAANAAAAAERALAIAEANRKNYAFMTKQIEVVQKDLEEKIKIGLETRNGIFTTNLDAQVAAEKDAADKRAKIHLNSYEYAKFQIKNEFNDKRDALRGTVKDTAEAMEAIADAEHAAMEVATRDWEDHLAEMDAATHSWTNIVTRTIGGIPDLLKSAFTGGGGLGGAVKGLFSGLGGDVGSKMFEAGGLLNSLGGKLTSGLSGLLGKSFGSAIGLALPGIGGALGSLVGPLLDKLFHIGGPSKQELEGRKVEGDFEKQFGSFDQMMKKVGEAYAATGRSAQMAQADVKALMDAEKQGGDAVKRVIDKINGAFNEQKQDAQDLDAAIKEYGFTIDQLGPTMQKQQLSEMAVKVENQFRLLVGSGIDMGLVTDKMSSKLNDYIHMAMKTGQEVPLEMKPILEQMIKQGDLTDENGNKITDLGDSGIKFSETFTQGIDRIIQKLDDLFGGVLKATSAIANIPTNVDIDINQRYHQSGDRDPSFADEAYVRRPTIATVGDVVGGEMVLKPQTIARWMNAAAMAGMNAGGGGGDSSALAGEITKMRSDIRAMTKGIVRGVAVGIQQARS